MTYTHNISTNNDNTFLADVIAIRDDLWAQDDAAIALVAGELSETFAMLDPDLAALFKDMKTVMAQYTQAKKTGQMAGILKWRFESAESAYQTRLMEVRRNKILAAEKNEISEIALEKRQLHEVTMQQKMNEEFSALREKRLKQKRRKEEGSGGWLFYFLLGMWIANMNKQRLEQDRLRYSFKNAKLA